MTPQNDTPDSTQARTQALFTQRFRELDAQLDRIFSFLFVGQWALALVFALFITPKTWTGGTSGVHPHVYAAILLGGLLTSAPVYLALVQPGAALNRYVITLSQMLYSVLFIHLTGGRIETHFHIFGSIAFIAMYRDWRLVIFATAITAIDHFAGGLFWPESMYGVLTATPWRGVEHAAWVGFEDIVLLLGVRNSRAEAWSMSESQVALAELGESLERQVEERTRQWVEAERMLHHASKMSSLGEMAGGVAHEINNPLAVIKTKSCQLEELLQDSPLDAKLAASMAGSIAKTVDRIAQIVQGMRTFSRDGSSDPFLPVSAGDLLKDTLSFCAERFRNHGVALKVEVPELPVEFEGRAVQISQVLLNLLNNAFDAVRKLDEKWVAVAAEDHADRDSVILRVTDSGAGIPAAIREKIYQPFFTTKEIGQGTGMGLSISLGIIRAHGGTITIDSANPHTCFVLELPKKQPQADKKEAA